jgi:hypothetical protein
MSVTVMKTAVFKHEMYGDQCHGLNPIRKRWVLAIRKVLAMVHQRKTNNRLLPSIR